MWTGSADVDGRRVVGWRGAKMGRDWFRAVVRVNRGMNERPSEARAMYMRKKSQEK